VRSQNITRFASSFEFAGNKRGVNCLWFALWVARLFAGEACGTVSV
jgi:hypothetical protein